MNQKYIVLYLTKDFYNSDFLLNALKGLISKYKIKWLFSVIIIKSKLVKSIADKELKNIIIISILWLMIIYWNIILIDIITITGLFLINTPFSSK